MMNVLFELALMSSQPLALHGGGAGLTTLEARAVARAGALAAGGQRISPATQTTRSGSIAIIPIHGMITQRSGLLSALGLATGCDQIRQALTTAIADRSISGIMLDIDSPGGCIYGIQELADEIFKARSAKPIYAIANSLAASAAYWIGAQCSELYCTPSGQVGSIGVYIEHSDISQALAINGQKVSIISAGRFKAEGNPYIPLDATARAAIQGNVDQYYSTFTKAVARGRGVPVARVRDGMGQGRCMQAKDAALSSMTDGIATLDQVITQMQRPGASTSRTVATVQHSGLARNDRLRLELSGAKPVSHDSKRLALELAGER